MRIVVCLLILGTWSLTGCQIYRSGGRNLFESQAPQHLTSTNVGNQSVDSTNGTQVQTGERNLDEDNPQSFCWVQPRDEKLWFPTHNKHYSITLIDEHSIETCLNDNDDNAQNQESAHDFQTE